MTFVPGRPVGTFGINGPYPGPTLRARQDDMVAFHVTNELGEPTTLHRHGMLLPAPVQCLTAITVALPFTSAFSPASVSAPMVVLLPQG